MKKGLTNQYLCIRNEDIDAYYERARMLSVEEQSSVQARNFKKETLAQIMNVRDGDMKTFREKFGHGSADSIAFLCGRYETSADACGAGNFQMR